MKRDETLPGENTMNEKPFRIDVHHHAVPAEYTRALKKIGIDDALGRPFPEWSAEQSLAVMDANGIAAAVTSVSSPGVYFGDRATAHDTARLCNDVSAKMVSEHPSRFGAFASLPLPDIDASQEEIARASDVLGMDGFVLLSNYDGAYVGDDRFQPVYAELDRRGAVVFLHPTDPRDGNPLGKEIPTFLMEVTFETTRVIFNLLYRGALERFPNIRWIFAHAGGALPYLTLRVSLGQFVLPDAAKTVPKGVLYYLKRLYYDTGLSASPYAFRALRELVEPAQILFGSDYPFAPEIVTSETVKGLRSYDGFSAEDLGRIEYANALDLFPRLKKLHPSANAM